MPYVGVDGVTRGQRLHEAHGRVLDGERHVLRGAGEGRGEKLSVRPAKAAIRPLARSPVPRPRCSHRFSTTTTAEPSGRIRATVSKPFLLLACSPTLWEPSGMNLLGGKRAWSGRGPLPSHSPEESLSPCLPHQSPGQSCALTSSSQCPLAPPAHFLPGGCRRDSGASPRPPSLSPCLPLRGGVVGPMQETPAWCGLGGPPSTHLKWPR